jgi:hypothetical protein
VDLDWGLASLSKEDLIRKLMLGKMRRSEYTNGRNQEIVAWVAENPEIKARIEAQCGRHSQRRHDQCS